MRIFLAELVVEFLLQVRLASVIDDAGQVIRKSQKCSMTARNQLGIVQQVGGINLRLIVVVIGVAHDLVEANLHAVVLQGQSIEMALVMVTSLKMIARVS